MKNPISALILVVLVVGIALPIAIGAVRAAQSVRADLDARAAAIESALSTE